MKSLEKNYKFWNVATDIFGGIFLAMLCLFIVFGVSELFNNLKIFVTCVVIIGTSGFLADYCENKKADFKLEILKRKDREKMKKVY